MVVKGVSDNLSDGDQSYAIILGADNTSTDHRFKYVDPPDVNIKNLEIWLEKFAVLRCYQYWRLSAV